MNRRYKSRNIQTHDSNIWLNHVFGYCQVIYSYQNNRNPFIDHPEFVANIWEPTSVNLSGAPEVRIFPNPVKDLLYFEGISNAPYSVINILGSQVQRGTMGDEPINVSKLPQGKYIILIENKATVIAKSFVKLP